MEQDELTGKGAEILKYIAEKEPGTQLELRLHWSSRTVWKQLRRLESQGWVVRQGGKYQATDSGLYELVCALLPRSRMETRRILKVAARKFPDGETIREFTWTLKKTGKLNLKEMAMRCLERPNIVLVCRTNAEGQVASMFSTGCKLTDVRISERFRGRPWRVVQTFQRAHSQAEPLQRTSGTELRRQIGTG